MARRIPVLSWTKDCWWHGQRGFAKRRQAKRERQYAKRDIEQQCEELRGRAWS